MLPSVAYAKQGKIYKKFNICSHNVYTFALVKTTKFSLCSQQKYCIFTKPIRKQAIVMQFTIVS